MSTFNAAASRVFSSFAGSPPPQQQSSLASGTASVVGHGSSTTSSAHVSPSPSQQALQSGAVSQGGGGGLDEATIKEATKGMTAEEEKQFRDKMKALMGVLEDEVKELQVQHTKLMNVTDKGETGKTLSKSNVRNMKSKSAGQRKEEPVLHGEGAQNMINLLREKCEEYEAEIKILKAERDSINYVKEQSKARIQMYEESIASTEKMLMESYQRLHVSANELSLKNRRIIELETKIGLKQLGKKTIEDARLFEDLHDKEVIQMKTRLGVLEKENLEQKLKLDALTLELKKTKDEQETEANERRARLERRRKDRVHTVEDDDEPTFVKAKPKETAAAATATTTTTTTAPSAVASVKIESKATSPEAASASAAPAAKSSAAKKSDEVAAPAAPKGPKKVKPILYKQGAPRRIQAKDKTFVSFSMNVLLLDGSLDGDLDLVKLCIKNGGDANQPNEEGLTPLHSAACNGHAKIVNFLLENGANVNVVDDDLWTPLHGAACFGEVAVVRDLVQHGANVAAANAENDLPMDIAVEEKTKKYLTEVNDNRKKATQLYALYDFEAEEDDELSFSAGAILTIITPEADRDTTWWTAQSVNKAKGFIPANFVGLYPPTKSKH